MFSSCTSLETAPKLSATTLAGECYYDMFSGCSNLASVEVAFTDWKDDNNATVDWLSGVAESGTFTCPAGLAEKRGVSFIPNGWTVVRK